MQTQIPSALLQTPDGQAADRILRSCVHCGFCTATCPTYQLLGDELDGPRGRIYLMKQLLEGQAVGVSTRLHLDRCLTCRSCETTCPSGVQYARLLDIGRGLVEQAVPRRGLDRWLRVRLRHWLPYPQRLRPWLRLAQSLRPLLWGEWRRKIPPRQSPRTLLKPPLPPQPQRRVLALAGCVQSLATPATNAAAARLLHRLGVAWIEPRHAGCCGALSQHLAAPEEARDFARRNIDAWWPYLEPGDGAPPAEAILISASGCGTQVKDYGELLRDDPQYRDQAARVGALARDLAEYLAAQTWPEAWLGGAAGRRLAFHSPCTLQHGQQIRGLAEGLLARAGYQLTQVADSHLCCGSAGTYSILQPELSRQLRDKKLLALQADQPELIATANIGCQLHLGGASKVPVRHWVELLEQAMRGR